ncbi:hypothetical protein, partial [Vibrio furnissii]|uniref:hypothetical protein n=1 Tax=Vibrio furnissii TaxID=29494 RepID=UPI001EEABE68
GGGGAASARRGRGDGLGAQCGAICRGGIEGRLFHPLSVWARAMLFIGALALALLDSDMINIAATIGIAMIAALNQLKGRQVLNARTD